MPGVEMLNAQGVAKRLGVAERTVRRWIERGWLPARRNGRVFEISVADADALASRVLPAKAHLASVLDLHDEQQRARLERERLLGRYEELQRQLRYVENLLADERRRGVKLELLLEERAA